MGVAADGKYVAAGARSADNKDRWFVTLDPESGKTRVIDTLHDDAWIREAGFGGSSLAFLPDNKRIWFLSEQVLPGTSIHLLMQLQGFEEIGRGLAD